ncbi:hypothetical protein PG996_000609 [Apiospora saccharicola]|uniref:Cystatin domain-containing protein n=1 Tax=Apiospora saccharicola TaxID=335842 RepID=A0ABR1WIB3_9PEZI
MPSNGDFEKDPTQNNWEFGGGSGWELGISQVNDSSDQLTWAFKASGSNPDTVAYLTTSQSCTLQAGITYQISLSVFGDVDHRDLVLASLEAWSCPRERVVPLRLYGSFSEAA